MGTGLKSSVSAVTLFLLILLNSLSPLNGVADSSIIVFDNEVIALVLKYCDVVSIIKGELAPIKCLLIKRDISHSYKKIGVTIT